MASIALSNVLLAMFFVVEGFKPQDFSFFHRGEKLVQQNICITSV